MYVARINMLVNGRNTVNRFEMRSWNINTPNKRIQEYVVLALMTSPLCCKHSLNIFSIAWPMRTIATTTYIYIHTETTSFCLNYIMLQTALHHIAAP